ncbi:tyrosine--tRNA ligase [Phenylobacterium aquaticum]|uniref:tyrosine--tRNA ligase n=1 Tax=Phenylobacterium aquaticum TaxID=1763816 RepID=UPI001F5CDC73|nr:tyrosine--tRNA ligase [Phenylobacterium aquaticum]MCI3135107.1 tyrosine--tRNA ligase [Phenylobacterium aquaticum]
MPLDHPDDPVLEPRSMTDAPQFTSAFLRTMQARGYIHQITHPTELDEAATKGPITAYIGFDATAASLHVGHLIQIMMLRRLQQSGHKPIVLMGGGTTKVGDPTDKDGQRPLLTHEQIQGNISTIRGTFEKFLTFGDGPTDAIMVDNDEWLSKFGYVEFLRNYGVHFTVNRMLAFDSVKARLDREQPMTFLEFNYMLMQSVDFLELERKFGCVLQMGGSDQWGNIVNGVELIRRVDQKPSFGLTTPLLSTASGQKMGKTVGGAVWLNADMRSPYDYWQFWRNTEDADVARFMKLFTDIPLDEVERYAAMQGAEINEAKKVLANAATTLLHGAEAAATAEAAARAAFEEGALSADLPTHEVPAAELEAGIVLAALAADAGLAGSRGEARRLAQGGGLRVNDKAEADANRTITSADLEGGVVKLAAGKKKIVLVKPV